MKGSEKSKSLVDSVYDRILALLHRRGLTSVEALNASSLAKELDVSRTPVNMALVRLESEGLIRKSAGQGWISPPLSLEDIEEVFDLKAMLEPLVARKAAENVSPKTAAELLGIVEEMETACEAKDLDRWLAADHRYHKILHDIAGNRRLKQFLERLNNQLYRLLVGHMATEGRMASASKEHRLIAEAVVSGNPDLAADRAVQRIQILRASMMDVMKNVLMPFLGQAL